MIKKFLYFNSIVEVQRRKVAQLRERPKFLLCSNSIMFYHRIAEKTSNIFLEEQLKFLEKCQPTLLIESSLQRECFYLAPREYEKNSCGKIGPSSAV